VKLTKPDIAPNPEHPAKFSEPILNQLRAVVQAEAARLGRQPVLLDSMCGTGRIHQLRPHAHTVGVELEPEWAACHPETWVGNALDLPAEWTNYFDIWMSSVVYPNRMTDHHDAKDKCKKCAGEGKLRRGSTLVECTLCKGRGLSPRKNYRTSLGRMPSEDSSAVLGWGDRYKDHSRRALAEAIRVVDDGGLVVVNVSNHYKGVKTASGTRSMVMRVVEWWIETMLARGLFMEAVLPVATSRMRHGANHTLRATTEQIIVCRKPLPIDDEGP
jgi:hypothetical protein